MSFTAELAARTVALDASRVPEAAFAVAKQTLLDTLAVALAARSERVVRATRDFVTADGGAGPSTLWGTGHRAGPARAALANGTAAHALDYDDVCWAMNAHPSAVLWPAVLAVAEATRASGAAALLAYVAGFEAEADVGAVLGRAHYAAGFHPTATLGTLGAAVAAGKLLGLDERAMRRAIGIACSEAAGSRMSFGTDTKPLHAGLAAQAGVTAALLAASGVTACETGIEGKMGLAELYGGGGEGSLAARSGFALVDPGVEVKPYPSCRFTHRLIDATLAVRARAGGRKVESVDCTVDPFAERIAPYRHPTNGQEAKFSLYYCAAVAWLDGHPGLEAFDDERAIRSDVQSLLGRVSLRHGSAEAEIVVVTFEDGSVEREEVRVAKGSPESPLTEAERLGKARACAAPLLGERVDALADAAATLADAPHLGALSALLASR